MTDPQSLTQQLRGIVSQISSLLNSQDEHLLLKTQPQPRVVYRSNVSYTEFLSKILQGKDKLHTPAKGDSYRLEEDLELLMELSQVNEEYTLKVFKRIADKGRLQRTSQSLKGRFQEQLFRIDQQCMLKIVTWLEREGLRGFLSFEDGQLRLSLNDPKEDKIAKEKAQAAAKKKPLKATTTQPKVRSVPTNCHQLNQVLRTYSRMVDIPIKTLLEKLNAVSGDFEALDQYIETRDEKILWTEEEDEILRKGGAEAAILAKHRGKSAALRKQYLQIN